MRRVIIFVFFAMSCVLLSAQYKNLSKMPEKTRNEYLLQKSKEVVVNFGPEWYRENMSVEISPLCVFKEDYDKRPEIQRNVGRKYYTLTFRYKQKQPDYYFAFDVSIWEDDGEPEGITFGNNFGLNFLFEPYSSLVKNKEKYQIPYDYELDRSLKMLYGE